ncbi:MAG: 23S rRNA (guanosine(2251)-2'-O)-methyltransferase RlmB [Acidobacteriota bacterium]|nr:23S rRNA (guanosine(2251)-2'-O)-methyltransferase RlmB [Acidobacteriota bacterium]
MSEWLSGRRVVREVLRGSNREVHSIWVERGATGQALDEIRVAAEIRGVEFREVEANEFAGLQISDAQRVAARCGSFRYRDEGDLPRATGDSSVLVVLDHLEDPQNTGAIMRTAEVAGCLGVCIPKRRSAMVTPAVARVSAGATEHLNVYRIGNVSNVVRWLQGNGYWTVALDGKGEETWSQVDYRGHIALVVGSEAKGVQRLVKDRCDYRVSLPLRGAVGSLNAGAAFAAVMYEVVRQQTT